MTKPVQAIQRCMRILVALNNHNGATVSIIAAKVGLSRGTVFRMLETLVGEQLVAKDPSNNSYWVTSSIQALSKAYVEEAWVTELAQPVLQALAAKIVWPVSVQRLERGAMHVRASTDWQSPFALWRSSVGARVPFFQSAGGRVYLAFAAPPQREAILQFVQSLGDPDAGGRLSDPAATDAELEQIRRDGFSITRKQIDSTVAVPIFANGEVFACLTARFLNRSLSRGRFMDTFGPALKGAAQDITAGLEGAPAFTS